MTSLTTCLQRSAAFLLVALLASGIGAPLAVGDESQAESEQAAPQDEQELLARVQGVLGAVEGLEGGEVTVKSGVVTLRGTADSSEVLQRAESLVRKVEGVLEVQNRIEVTQEVRRRVAPALARLRELGRDLVGMLPILGIALLIIVLGVAVARLLGKWSWLFARISDNRFAQDLARQLVRAAIIIGAIVLALEVLDATALVGAVLGTAGIVGLAIGFAFRDLFENYLASILLSVRQPFRPGDHVHIGDHEGKVLALSTRATTLRTLDGNHLRMLNADVYKSVIINYTTNPRRRFDFAVGLGTDVDLAAARSLGLDTLQAMEGVVPDPRPMAVIEELGDSSVLLRLYGWVDQRRVDFFKTRGEAIRLVKQAFEEHEFDMPEPIQRVRLERFVAGGESQARPRPTRTARVVDVEPEKDLDEEIAEERRRMAERDLLAASSS